ncbi:MAG: ATP-dependent protease, partial [Candidatus Competibacter sp.]|nr:ATP-dependent protease [Candidatus Competibacter sp.]
EENSATVRARVHVAHDRQLQRAGKPNSALNTREIERYCVLGETDHRLLEQALERLGLSPRAYHRILKVARTIADLAGSDGIKTPHLTEAISYRALDRTLVR